MSGSALGGLRQVSSNQSFEGLIRYGSDGRPRPWLAKSWSVAPDRRSITLDLRPEAKFHDGTPANAAIAIEALKQSLPQFLGSLYEDVSEIRGSSDGRQIVIAFRQPSPLLLEGMEAPIRKPGTNIGTGPFVVATDSSTTEMRANDSYYLGRPTIDRIVVSTYPTTRSAWAELLRNKIDMLYEVSADAETLMQDATTVSTFDFTRPYQYMVLLNVKARKFASPEVRRALNTALDRNAIVRDGFLGHAIPSVGLVWPQNWAFDQSAAKLVSDPQSAAKVLSPKHLQFTCLVPTDYERAALVVQQQLAAVGVNMQVQSVSPDVAFKALDSSDFEAVLIDSVGGPSLLRLYIYWDTHGSIHPRGLGSPELNDALDRIRHAASDDEYRSAVSNLQSVTIQDAPAMYLAWGQRARAVSKRFVVPQGEPGRDVLATLRLWKPSTDPQTASRN